MFGASSVLCFQSSRASPADASNNLRATVHRGPGDTAGPIAGNEKSCASPSRGAPFPQHHIAIASASFVSRAEHRVRDKARSKFYYGEFGMEPTNPVQLLTDSLIESLVEKAKHSPRLRMNHNFHAGPEDNPHRFLNFSMSLPSART